ncbi:MAG: hypothetical protein M5U28_18590 [Sandaracinaceae bacterium]|nr:hypothetical protein [Sandaracinaceae bacterium]
MRAPAPPEGAPARRAHQRRRSGEPARAVGARLRAGRRGHGRAPEHPVHGRGGALPPRRPHARWPRRRRGSARRADRRPRARGLRGDRRRPRAPRRGAQGHARGGGGLPGGRAPAHRGPPGAGEIARAAALREGATLARVRPDFEDLFLARISETREEAA